MDLLLFAVVGLLLGAWAFVVTVASPRKVLYLLLALTPTQFLFVPVSSFFLSPGDGLVAVSSGALLFRLAARRGNAWRSVVQHRFVILMVLSYLVGFVVLGVSSRTLIRLPMAAVISVLAVELLTTRRHLARAATMLIIAGVVDAGYGLLFIALGRPLHPTRFSGMSDVNFAAMVILTSAAVALAQISRSRRAFRLMRPGTLGSLAMATLSQMGMVAVVAAWLTVLRRFVSRANKIRIVTAIVAILVLAIATPPVRDRIMSRNVRQVQADGVERNSTDIRWLLHRTAWDGFMTSPVFGLGFFKFVDYSTTDPAIYAMTGGLGYPTHNTYLEVLTEGGILTFALFVLHWRQYVAGLGRILRTAARARDGLAAACLVGLPVILICAALANVLLVYSFWSVAGVSLACLNLLRREARHSQA
jgi:O-Antigen ligase